MHANASLTVLATVFSVAWGIILIQLKIVMKRSLLALSSLQVSAYFEKIQMTHGIIHVTPLESVA